MSEGGAVAGGTGKRKRGTHERANVEKTIYHLPRTELAYKHRLLADAFEPGEACDKSRKLGGVCSMKLTRKNMQRAHNCMFSTQTTMRERGGGRAPLYSCSLSFQQIKQRRVDIRISGFAKHID